MTPQERLERLLAEELPTGQWGGPRTAPHDPRSPISAIQAAEHVRTLIAELDQHEGRGTGKPERHLQALPDTHAA